MAYELPDFDALCELAETDPGQLDILQKEMNAQFIESAPDAVKQRLRGILFQIDMQRRLAKNPMHLCWKISEMMHESVLNLRDVLTIGARNGESRTGIDLDHGQQKLAKVHQFQT
jgi:hypothetical protein